MSLMETTELLGNIGEFVGAIAVVATLIYLTVQLRQNSALLKANADAMQVAGYQHLRESISTVNKATLENEDLARIMHVARNNPEELSEIDMSRVMSLFIMMTRHADVAFLQYQKGMLDEEQYFSSLGPMLGSLRGDFHYRRHAERVCTSELAPFSSAFKAEIRRLLAQTEESFQASDSGMAIRIFREDIQAFREWRSR